MLICTILLYVCVLDTIYGLVTKKIAVGFKEDNRNSINYNQGRKNRLSSFGVTIIFLKFPEFCNWLCRAKHNTTAACQQRRVEQVHIKCKCMWQWRM